MNYRFLICASALALFGCASERPPAAPETHTLAGTARLPLNGIETLVSPTKWARLRDLEYERFVVMEAEIQPDGTVKAGRIIEAFPDMLWVGTAKTFAHKVELRAASVGSHLNKTAELVVVFFKPVLEGNLVLVFGRQVDEPDVGMTKRAMYFNTFLY
jgi:hypothetical protein